MKPGPTGDYPRGKLRHDDKGGIAVVVHAQAGNVIMDYGAQVVWVGMPPEQAEQLAAMLIAKAREARASQS